MQTGGGQDSVCMLELWPDSQLWLCFCSPALRLGPQLDLARPDT